MELKVKGINSLLVEGSRLLLKHAIKRKTRGYVCYEISEPTLISFTNPKSRIVTIKERKWNPYLPFVETLWILTGSNDITLPSSYVKSLSNYSDDGLYMRAGYGPRIRCYNGERIDYRQSLNSISECRGIDQLKYVIHSLNKESSSRRAVITVADPNKDIVDQDMNYKVTKDYPCTQNLHFLVSSGKLDLTVHMRSNDFLWGASAVNIPNFTLIQEIIASILGLEVGCYYHVANNLHYYEDQRHLISSIADVISYEIDTSYHYTFPQSINKLDLELSNLYEYQEGLNDLSSTSTFSSEFSGLQDWAGVLKSFHTKRIESIENSFLKKAIQMKLS
jgi:thymidylate synthase